LRTIQDWIVRRQLLGVEGVADVSSFGGKLKQYHVKLNPDKMRSMKITVNDVFTALENNNQNTGGSYIEKGPTVLLVRSEGLISSIAEIETIPVSYHSSGTPIHIKDIAKVEIDNATRYGAMTYNDEGETVGAVVMMLKGANSNLVISAVKARIEEIQTALPPGVFIEPFLDRTKMVNNAISTVETNLMEGALIVVFVLVLFLGNLRAGLLVASIIPLAMLFAVIMMNIFGVSGNLMSLGALDFGLIVDGAVIIVEAVMHRLSHSKSFSQVNRLSQDEMDETVQHSAGKMMNSAVFGQIIILIVYLPIFTLEGIEGKMFMPMAQTVMFALLGAFILSLTYIPMMSALFLSKTLNHSPTFSDKAMAKVEHFFQTTLGRVLNHPVKTLGVVTSAFLVSMILLFNMGGEFIPALEEGDFAVDTRVLTGSNLNTTIEYTQKTAKLLKERYPEVIKVVTKIGSGEIPTDPMPIEASDMMVILKPKKEWTSARTFPELAEKMSATLTEIPGVTAGFQFPVQMRFNELMTGARQDVVCKIFGEDLDSLAKYAAELGALAEGIDGAKDVYVEPITGLPQILIRYNRAELARYKLTISDVNRIVQTNLAGEVAGMIFEGERRFELIVKLDESFRKSKNDIANLLIPLENGDQIHLSTVANVEIEIGPNQIQREDAKRRIVVGFNIRGRDVQSIVQDLQASVGAKLSMSPGYYITYGGAFENLEAAKWRLAIAVPIALGLIFLMLYFAFGSVKKGLLIYTAIPLSAIGGILALYTRGMPFSISAGIGFIALFGVAVLNGIVLIAEFTQLKNDGLNDVKQIVLKGTKTRLRPVLMTAMVASLGFLPMALSNGAGAEVQRPLATVVIGGLLIATFLTLFILPTLYVLFENKEFEQEHPLLGSIKALIPLLFLLSPSLLSAQTSLTENEAVQMALKNNLTLESKRLSVLQKHQQKNTAWNLPNTTFAAEFGKFNTFENDSRFSIEQQFSFPTVYMSQSSVFETEKKRAEFEVLLTEKEIQKRVRFLFYAILIEQERLNYLNKMEVRFAKAQEKAELRKKVGETTSSEWMSISLQSNELKQKIAQTKMDVAKLEQEFKVLLKTNETFALQAETILIDLPQTTVSSSHPFLEIQKNEISNANALLSFKKAAWAPNFKIGFNSMTFVGMPDANGTILGSSTRFSSFLVGFDLPLFFHTQLNEVKMAKSMVQIKEKMAQEQVLLFNESKTQAHLEMLQLHEQVETYTSSTLEQLKTQQSILETQLNTGSISLVEWTWLVKLSLDAQMNYFEVVKRYTKAVTEFEFLNTEESEK
ncbi:MAG: CusA/CzcA family heavy metal efflux RND transporter, partial [Bacteroidetes bacterium]|nr:CusA/CzcA family heavy metal efflux RND transporter [Bacteroidota bacterium]